MSKESQQHRTSQSGGAQLVGKPPSAPVRKVPAFQGRSGQAANSDTYRTKGR